MPKCTSLWGLKDLKIWKKKIKKRLQVFHIHNVKNFHNILQVKFYVQQIPR
jgi:hypothetical protein